MQVLHQINLNRTEVLYKYNPTLIKKAQSNTTLDALWAPPALRSVYFPQSLVVLAPVQRQMWIAADVVTAVVIVPHIEP